MMKTFRVLSACKYCKKWAKASCKTGGTWVTKAFSKWTKAVAKMKEYAESEGRIHACQVETSSATALIRYSTIATSTGK